MQLCLNRFDDETKQAFLDLYSKVDDKVDLPDEDNPVEVYSEVATSGNVWYTNGKLPSIWSTMKKSS